MTNRSILPVGDRKDDPPHKGWRWRLGLMINKYPIQAAGVLAIMLLSVPVGLIIDQQAHLRSDARDLRAATDTTKRLSAVNSDLIAQISTQREQNVKLLCTDNGAIVSVLSEIPKRLRTPKQEKALKDTRAVNCAALIEAVSKVVVPSGEKEKSK